MSRINVGRVIAGGLLAGLVINVSEAVLNLFVVAESTEAALRERNVPQIGNSAIAQFVILGFLLGIGSVWLYAAIRPRFGAGLKAAAIAALAVWALAYAYPAIGMSVMQLFPAGLMVLTTIWGLPEIVVATVAGAWVYQE